MHRCVLHSAVLAGERRRTPVVTNRRQSIHPLD